MAVGGKGGRGRFVATLLLAIEEKPYLKYFLGICCSVIFSFWYRYVMEPINTSLTSQTTEGKINTMYCQQCANFTDVTLVFGDDKYCTILFCAALHHTVRSRIMQS